MTGTENVMAVIDENGFCETSVARTSTVGTQTDELECLCKCHQSLPDSEAKVKGQWQYSVEFKSLCYCAIQRHTSGILHCLFDLLLPTVMLYFKA